MNDMEKTAIELVKANPGEYAADCERLWEIVSRSKALYKGEPVPFLYVPALFSMDDVERFRCLLADVMVIIDKSIAAYLADPAVRRYFGFDPRLDALIRLDHGYSRNVPMGRFDIFPRAAGEFQFCELNTDGSSAMNEDFVLASILADSALMRELEDGFHPRPFELFDTWVDEVDVIYREYGGEADRPFVAIVDILDKGSPVEFEEFKKRFIAKGSHCEIVDAADIDEKGGFMFAGDRRIDVVYRRLVTRDLMERYDDLPGLTRGLLANKTCVIGPLKSQIAHTKKFFAFLHHPDFQGLFSDAERDFIARRVPFTTSLADADDLDHYIRDKDDYIVKPVDYYASKGVLAGRDQTRDEWRRVITERAKDGDAHIIQKFCSPGRSMNVLFDDDGGVDVIEFNNVTGLFVYNGTFSGIYSRANRHTIISGLHDCYTCPSFLVNDR